MEFLTSYQGKNHLTSAQFRDIIGSLAGNGSYIANIYENMEIELAENNTVKIRSGVLFHHGGVGLIERGTYDQVSYQNGTQAMKRIDLLVSRYSKDAASRVEKKDWVIIQGTPAESNPQVPECVVGDMQAGDLIDDCPFAELHFDGINVTEVKMLVGVTKNIKELEGEVRELNSKISAAENIKLPIVREFYLDDVSINASSYSSNVRVPIDDIDGYTPYVVGWSMKGASSGGANNTNCFSYNHTIEDYNGIKATFGIRNYATSVAKIKVDATILYIPNI